MTWQHFKKQQYKRQQQQEMGSLRFQRNELNGQAIRRLKAVLTEAQVAELGGLPTPVEEDENYFLR